MVLGVTMDISVSRLLDKIGDELNEAKGSESNAKLREHAYAMKAICELILEESSHSRSTNERSRQRTSDGFRASL